MSSKYYVQLKSIYARLMDLRRKKKADGSRIHFEKSLRKGRRVQEGDIRREVLRRHCFPKPYHANKTYIYLEMKTRDNRTKS